MAYSLNGADYYGGPEQETEQRVSGTSSRLSPPSVQMVQLWAPTPVIHPDTEENVEAQTEEVFLNYVYQSYRNDTMREETNNLPQVPELLNFTAAPVSPAAEIGRHLAKIGDDLNEKYKDTFDKMISALSLPVDAENTYDAFANIGQRVFANGINWGRIMILLTFGYRMAIRVLQREASRVTSFLARIVSFVCRFVVSERIARWIADHGGWREALNFIPSASSRVFYLVSGLAAITVLAVISFNRFLK